MCVCVCVCVCVFVHRRSVVVLTPLHAGTLYMDSIISECQLFDLACKTFEDTCR